MGFSVASKPVSPMAKKSSTKGSYRIGYQLDQLSGNINVDCDTNSPMDGCSEADDLSHAGEDIPGQSTVSPHSHNNKSCEGWY